MSTEAAAMLANLRRKTEAFHASLDTHTADLRGREVECRFEIITGNADCGLPDRFAAVYEVWDDGEDIVDSLTDDERDYLAKQCEGASLPTDDDD